MTSADHTCNDECRPPCDHCSDCGHSFEDCHHEYCYPARGEHTEDCIRDARRTLASVDTPPRVPPEPCCRECRGPMCDCDEAPHTCPACPVVTKNWRLQDGRLVADLVTATDAPPGTVEWFAEERRRRDAARDEAAAHVAAVSAGLNQRLAADDGGTGCDDPACGYGEPHKHGFACDRTCRACEATRTFKEEPWWRRARIRLRWAKEALFDDVG
ncbi:hypothetical protein [Streptomyces roseolus]|uniref:hypothetical protein n=1 Tax=Streptomyces roseolus TaxID=67358 RepID=UPI0016734A10|nr:hypothetical protein [Streptomyces roseolus]GGR51765.1 hypothetical protein GCM10010282_50870 [Streptomyces roseolus]